MLFFYLKEILHGLIGLTIVGFLIWLLVKIHIYFSKNKYELHALLEDLSTINYQTILTRQVNDNKYLYYDFDGKICYVTVDFINGDFQLQQYKSPYYYAKNYNKLAYLP